MLKIEKTCAAHAKPLDPIFLHHNILILKQKTVRVICRPGRGPNKPQKTRSLSWVYLICDLKTFSLVILRKRFIKH